MTNTLSAVFCSDLVLSEKSIRQRERFCLEILREIQHSATESKDKMTWGVGVDRCPFSMEKQLGQLVADDLGYSYRTYIEKSTLSIYNYLQILYQFLTLTQILKQFLIIRSVGDLL